MNDQLLFFKYKPSVDMSNVDFRKRFLTLLSFKFREFGGVTALSILEATDTCLRERDEEESRGVHFLLFHHVLRSLLMDML